MVVADVVHEKIRAGASFTNAGVDGMLIVPIAAAQSARPEHSSPASVPAWVSSLATPADLASALTGQTKRQTPRAHSFPCIRPRGAAHSDGFITIASTKASMKDRAVYLLREQGVINV